jgi:hypothetical protein
MWRSGRGVFVKATLGYPEVRPNHSLEWTSASWPRYAACIFSAPRGQLAAAPQLERYAAG